MDLKSGAKKAAKKVKSGLMDAGDGDLLAEMDGGEFDVVRDPSTGASARKEDVPYEGRMEAEADDRESMMEMDALDNDLDDLMDMD